MNKRSEIADALTRIGIYHLSNKGIVATQLGINGQCIADIISIDWHNKIRIIEVKSCRQDFLSDFKWWNYTRFCDYFYFLAPPKVIHYEELPSHVGLLNPYNTKRPMDQWHSCKVIKKPKKLKLIEKEKNDIRLMVLRSFAWESRHAVHNFCPKCGRSCVQVPTSMSTANKFY